MIVKRGGKKLDTLRANCDREDTVLKKNWWFILS